MAFTLAGWSESIDATVLAPINALKDQHLTVDGKDLIVPGLNQLLGYYAVGSALDRAQLSAPSLRDIILMDIEPLDMSAKPLSIPNLIDRFDNPLPLVTNEALNALIAEVTAGPARNTVLVWFGDRAITPVGGEIHTLRATGATPLVPYEWTAVPITLTQQLPAGRYALVGLRARSAGMIAARVIIPGTIWRPGVIGCDSVDDVGLERFRLGNCGIFGEFQHNLLPQIECLSASADTTQVFHLDIVKIG